MAASRQPDAGYSVTAATWLRMGGVYVLAALRGGGEYGARTGTEPARSCASRTCSTTSSARPNG